MQNGFPYVDYNGPTQVGVSYLQLSLENGISASSSRAYLHPISNRPNLHVNKYTMVKKIVIDPQTQQVQGVEMVKNGRTYFTKVKKEVISSAGSINSLQLLMLSGVGPKKHLSDINECLPVTKNILRF
ncbi:unnamed protein product [Ceutorhynchus assimilis]|uniref:Glucose-methanol-choline oxidoreductase N-terminal domain-containing protein n=1 Tax=Ceutorhynchus assimilis TaxID=467358 RepID=A0A9N9MVB7_9CUCU|nr:unnamed protein product [Ceutorhynchus assimilis]